MRNRSGNLRRWIATCLAAASMGGPTAAAETTPQAFPLTLAQAIEAARTHSPGLARLEALSDAADAGAREARAGRMPEVDLTAGYTRNSNVPELVLQRPGLPPQTIFPNLPDSYRSRLEVSVPVYTGGRISGSIAAAEGEQVAARRDAEAGGADLVLEATSTYWALVTAREEERVLGEAIASFEAHLKSARDRQEVGMAARNEVLAVQVERDRAELARLLSANAGEVANADLARLLGLPPRAMVEPSEPLLPPEAPSRGLESLVDQALGGRPERAALQSRVSAAEERARAERAGWRPRVGVTLGYDYANPNRKILPLEPEYQSTWDASVNLSLSVFDGGRTAAAVARASAEAEAARRQLQDLDERIRLEVTSRFLDLQTAIAAAEVAERNQAAAEENRRVAGDRYREGVIPSSELLDAETALLRAGLDRTEALVRIRLILAGLERAVGG